MVSFRKQNNIEFSIQMAQLLMHPQNHSKLKSTIQKTNPFLPVSLIDVCIDVASDAFQKLTPEKLKLALSPGGFDKFKLELQASIITLVLQQQVVQDLPILSSDQKEKLVEFVVERVIEYLIKDAEYTLAPPEVRLEALEEEMKYVQQMMGFWRLMTYRIRKHKRKVMIIGTMIGLVVARYVWKGDFLLRVLIHSAKDVYVQVAMILAGMKEPFMPILDVLLQGGKDISSSIMAILSDTGKFLMPAFRFMGDKLSWIFSLVMDKMFLVKDLISHHVITAGQNIPQQASSYYSLGLKSFSAVSP